MPDIGSRIQETIGEANYLRLENLYEQRQDEEVVALSALLINRAPDLYPLYMLQGASLERLGDPEKAIACLQTALEFEPGHQKLLVQIAECLQRAGRIDEAVPYLAENFYLHPQWESGAIFAQAAAAKEPPDLDIIDMVMKAAFEQVFASHPDLKLRESLCEDIVQWCENRGHPIIEIEAAREVSLVDAAGRPVAPYRTTATRFVVLRDTFVMAGWPHPVASTGEMLHQSSPVKMPLQPFLGRDLCVPYLRDLGRGRIFHPWPEEVIDIDDDVLLLGSPRLHHFGHWIYDFLPKLRAWRYGGGKAPKIFIPADLPRAQRDTLAQFGVRPDDMIEGELCRVYRCKTLRVSVDDHTYFPVPSSVKFLHTALALQTTPAVAGADEGRYFLQRSQTRRGRAIANQEELDAVLTEFEVSTIRRPELSVAQQNALFSEAGIIISPFGSDLVTKFQVRPGTDIITLQFEKMEDVYEGLVEPLARYCAILGLPLHHIECSLKRSTGRMEYHGDLFVDCKALRRTLADVIARRNGGRT